MAAITEDRKKFEAAFMADFWNLRKKHGTVEMSDGYWDSVMNDVNMLGAKYGHDKYIEIMLMALIEDLEDTLRMAGGKRRDMAISFLNSERRSKGLPIVIVKEP